MLYLLFLLKWICSIQKNYFDVKKATFFLSATVQQTTLFAIQHLCSWLQMG